MELSWLQGKLQWTPAVNNWTKSYHYMSPRNIQKSNDKTNMKNYEQYDYIHDTGLRASGGVSILIRKNIPQSKINISTPLQAVAISATLHKTTAICSMYIPPQDPINEEQLNNLINQLPKPYILMGDFNSHNILWGSRTTNKRGQTLEKIINNNNLCLHNRKAQTHLSSSSGTFSAIDLTLSDPATFIEYNWRVHEDSCGSDHFPIIIENTKPGKSDPQTVSKTPRWNFKKANWQAYKKLCLDTLIPETNTNQEEPIIHFTNTLINIANKTIPKTTTSPKHNNPWFTEECKTMIRERQRILRKFKTNPSSENLDKYRQQRAKTRRTIKEAKRSSWRNFTAKINSNTNPKTIWNFVKKISNKTVHAPINHLSLGSTKALSEKQIANLMAENFAQASSIKKYSNKFNSIRIKEEKNKIKFTSDDTKCYNQLFTLDELQNSLSKSNNSAAGPDEIHYTFLKELPTISQEYLLNIYNNIWISGNIPTLWKQATIIPILKKQKDPTNPTSYRPIALTSCACKTLERIINQRLIWFLESNKLLSNLQAGFRTKRSTMDQVVHIETLIRETCIKKEHLVAVFFDLEKAYDTTWPYGILKDLKNFGLQGRLPIFIQNFLEDRSFRTLIGSTYSDPKPQEVGVPQGSILSVSLFIIKINSITSCLPPEIKGSLYVDDFLICYNSKNMTTIERKIQQCINKIQKWTTENGFTISNSKTKCVHFCQIHKMHNHPKLTLNNPEIPITDEHKFLGIIFDSKLSFIPHIKKLRIKCNQAMQLLRATDWGADRKTLIKLYRSLIRSKLDYGCFIYGAARKSYLQRLETIHHQGLRLTLGAFNTSPKESLYIEANEPPLYLRRKKLALQYYIKLIFCPQNPAYDYTGKTKYENLYQNNPPKIRPFSLRISDLLNEIKINTKIVHYTILSKTAPWTIRQPTINLELAKLPKTKTHPITYQEKLIKIQNKFPDHYHIYTDGSKQGKKVGCAVISQKKRNPKTPT